MLIQFTKNTTEVKDNWKKQTLSDQYINWKQNSVMMITITEFFTHIAVYYMIMSSMLGNSGGIVKSSMSPISGWQKNPTIQLNIYVTHVYNKLACSLTKHNSGL